MSDTIRLNIKSGKAVARYGEKYLADVAEESPEEALNRQLNEQFPKTHSFLSKMSNLPLTLNIALNPFRDLAHFRNSANPTYSKNGNPLRSEKLGAIEERPFFQNSKFY